MRACFIDHGAALGYYPSWESGSLRREYRRGWDLEEIAGRTAYDTEPWSARKFPPGRDLYL